MTQAIRIRPYTTMDAAALHEAARSSVAEVFPWLPWCHPGYSLAEAEQWAASRGQLFDEGIEYNFAIVDSTDRFLGGCGLNQVNRIHLFANLGYWVRTSETGRGIAPLAVRRIAEFAFSKTDLVRLEIVCQVDNLKSQRVAEKAGAVREGILRDRLVLGGAPRDAVMHSLLRSQWSGV